MSESPRAMGGSYRAPTCRATHDPFAPLDRRFLTRYLPGMKERPKTTFTIEVRGETLTVEYTPEYFATSDHFAYLSPHVPLRPHILSETGYRSHFAPKEDVVEAGGPEEFALKYADEVLAEVDGRKPRKGGHAAKVKDQRQGGLTQREMF